MNISVVIPNYNGEEILRKNLPKVFEELKKFEGKVEVVVVDDASSDSSVLILEEMRKNYSNLIIVTNNKNLGFSGNVNKGVSRASGEIIVLLNTDVYPEKGFLQPLIQNFDDENIFAVGCMDKSIEDGKIILRGRGLGSWRKGFLSHRRGEVDSSDTFWVSCGSGAFRKDIWNKLGGLNELYSPFYWEDIDLSYRAQKAGYKVLFEPKSIVFHEHSEGAIKKNNSNYKIKIVAYRNQFLFVWLNITDLSLIISHLFFIPYHMINAIRAFEWAFILGFLKALILFPKVIEFRLKARRLFVLKDTYIIK